MNEEIKALWLTALRSGDYKQGKGALNKNGKFCCLGVLCDLAVKAGVTGEVHGARFTEEVRYGLPTEVQRFGIPPMSIIKWSGMMNSTGLLGDPIWVDGSMCNDLPSLNDMAGYTFLQIADVIEAQL